MNLKDLLNSGNNYSNSPFGSKLEPGIYEFKIGENKLTIDERFGFNISIHLKPASALSNIPELKYCYLLKASADRKSQFYKDKIGLLVYRLTCIIEALNIQISDIDGDDEIQLIKKVVSVINSHISGNEIIYVAIDKRLTNTGKYIIHVANGKKPISNKFSEVIANFSSPVVTEKKTFNPDNSSQVITKAQEPTTKTEEDDDLPF